MMSGWHKNRAQALANEGERRVTESQELADRSEWHEGRHRDWEAERNRLMGRGE